MLSSFYNQEAILTKNSDKIKQPSCRNPNSLRLEIPRYLEIALGHFCETSPAKSISRESANKDCNSIKSENHCDVIVTWYSVREKIMCNVIIKFSLYVTMCYNVFTIKTKLFKYRRSKGERYQSIQILDRATLEEALIAIFSF